MTGPLRDFKSTSVSRLSKLKWMKSQEIMLRESLIVDGAVPLESVTNQDGNHQFYLMQIAVVFVILRLFQFFFSVYDLDNEVKNKYCQQLYL